MKPLISDIYRSKKKEGMYLYLGPGKKINDVPEALIHAFGQAELAMKLAITPDKKLARADAAKVYQALTDPGYYLQMPPVINEDMQKIHQLNSKFLIE